MTEAPTDDEGLTYDRISSASVRRATGRGWSEWLGLLDEVGASAWDHKEIVAHLERTAPEVTAWWRQSITVGYEQARGKRIVGQTADAGFQLGVQRSAPVTSAEAWDVIENNPELWLGGGSSFRLVEGERYEVPATGSAMAATGEIRVVKPGERLRMTWQPEGWANAATLQITLSQSTSGKTAVRVHLEKLPDAPTRDEMRRHWRGVLGAIVDAVT